MSAICIHLLSIQQRMELLLCRELPKQRVYVKSNAQGAETYVGPIINIQWVPETKVSEHMDDVESCQNKALCK